MNTSSAFTLNGISILIPCAGRVSLLKKLLESVQLARQNFTMPTEVLLLDNSRGNEQNKVKSLAETYDATFCTGTDNLSQKRNTGASLAAYDLILFLDSDCEVDKDILEEHYNSYSSSEIAGCLGLLNFVGEDTLTWMSVERTGVLSCFSIASDQKDTLWGPTANISFRRDIFLRVGGFDTAFSRPGGEDVDLGFRLTDAGWRITCNPKAIAYHTKETWSSFWQVYERFLRYGSADALLIRKHVAHTVVDFPMSTQYAAVLLAFSLLWISVAGLPSIILPVLWAICSIIIYTVMSKRGQAPKTYVAWNISAQELILLTGLDFGRLLGALKYREVRAFYKRILFFDEQLTADWPGVSMGVVASTFALILTLLFLSVMVQFGN